MNKHTNLFNILISDNSENEDDEDNNNESNNNVANNNEANNNEDNDVANYVVNDVANNNELENLNEQHMRIDGILDDDSDNLVQFNIISNYDYKDFNEWNIVESRCNKKDIIKLIPKKTQSKKWFKDNTWAHHYLLGNVCDKYKIPFFLKSKETKKLGELYQNVYLKHLSEQKKMYNYLVDLQDSLKREGKIIWKHKYYMGIYCDKNGIPLYEMDSARKEKAISYQQDHSNINKITRTSGNIKANISFADKVRYL